VAIDDENDPATLGFGNIQSCLLASLEEVCRSVRFNLKTFFSLEGINRAIRELLLRLNQRPFLQVRKIACLCLSPWKRLLHFAQCPLGINPLNDVS
jgi:hypothetical protein